MNLVALGEQEFCEIGTILTRDASDECFLHKGCEGGAQVQGNQARMPDKVSPQQAVAAVLLGVEMRPFIRVGLRF
jgi:hypothetical protein